MSMISRQSVRPSSFLQAEWIPMLADCTSASMPSARWCVGALEVSSDVVVEVYRH